MTKMTATATAIWNDEKGYWEVEIFQTYDDGEVSDERYDIVKVCDCDEAVIPEAILSANGILVNGLFADNHFPIVEE